MGLGRHVADARHLEPGRLERADRRLAAGARPLDEHLDLLEAVLHALPRRGVGGHLRGERRRLAGAFEAGRAGGLPGDDVPFAVGQRHDGVVEARLDVGLADRDVLANTAARAAQDWLLVMLAVGLSLNATDQVVRVVVPVGLVVAALIVVAVGSWLPWL